MRDAEGNFFKASLQAEELAQAKMQIFALMQQKNKELQVEMDKIKEAYGEVVINIEDGTIKPAPAQEAEEVKN
jgi:membrane protein insertase Oxa1/YidC/SpoIIIJ